MSHPPVVKQGQRSATLEVGARRSSVPVLSQLSHYRRRVLQLTLGALLAGSLGSAMAQSESSPARLIIGFPPGGSADTIARLLAERLTKVLDRPVIVDNRPGAGGRVAVPILRDSPPDGATVMLAPETVSSTAPIVFNNLNYDPATDYLPISLVVQFPFAFATGTDPRVATFEEYVEWAKANPQRVTYGSPAPGSPPHFFGLLIGDAIGVDMVHVPFQGTAPIMTNLAGGQISAGISTFGDFIEQHRGGDRINVVAVSSEERMPQLPEVPTFAELGYPDATGTGFYALYAPPGTSDAHINRWNQAIADVLAMPDVQERFGNLGLVIRHTSPEEVTELTLAGRERWRPVIEASGYTPD